MNTLREGMAVAITFTDTGMVADRILLEVSDSGIIYRNNKGGYRYAAAFTPWAAIRSVEFLTTDLPLGHRLNPNRG